MPVGVQVVGARGGDRRTVGFARAVEKKIGGFKEPEGFE
jgi:Asp-tRNA(Asn)/Glu-tRNA(Gln) amidotransferase A subunit family amidase